MLPSVFENITHKAKKTDVGWMDIDVFFWDQLAPFFVWSCTMPPRYPGLILWTIGKGVQHDHWAMRIALWCS